MLLEAMKRVVICYSSPRTLRVPGRRATHIPTPALQSREGASWGRKEGLASGRGAGGGQPGPGSRQGSGAGKAAETRSPEPAAGLVSSPKRLEFPLRAAGGPRRF